MIRKHTYYYLRGDTYSEDILPFLISKFPHTKFIIIDPDQIADLKIAKWIVMSPTIDGRGKAFLSKLASDFKVALLLDWNFQGFNDVTPLLEFETIRVIFSPFQVNHAFYKPIPSVHYLMMKERVKPGVINHRDLFFCSQPLKEDRPELGFDQYDLLRQLMAEANSKNVNIYVKRHPRERADLPTEITLNPRVKVFEGSIEEALSQFGIWYGHSSIALYVAKEFGHEVHFLYDKICSTYY